MHDSFTLATVLVRGHRKYDTDYLVKLKSMVERNTSKSMRMVCFTDGSYEIPAGIEPIIIEPLPGIKAWWNKLLMFGEPRLSGRILYLDLDILVVANLDAIVDYPAEFAIAQCSAPGWLGKDGLVCVKGFNSSVMVWDAGSRPKLGPSRARIQFYAAKFWGDQDAIKKISPDEATFPANWVRRLSAGGPESWNDDTKIILAIGCKNHRATKRYEWFGDYWR